MKPVAIVALGGATGSLVRYLVAELLPSYPLAILIANILGVAIAGLVAYRISVNEKTRLFLIPGVAGGMTTFSSVALIHSENESLIVVAYFFGTVALSMLTLFFCKPKATR